MCPRDRCGFHGVRRVQTLMFVWMVKEEGVSILVSDIGHQGDTPKLSPRAYVPSEDSYLGYSDLGHWGIVKIDLTVIVDGSVASLDHFYGAEERVAHKGWDNVDGACWFRQFVVQFVIFSCSCCGTIGEIEHGRQDCVCGN